MLFFRTIILIMVVLISFFSDIIMDVKYFRYAVKHFLRNYTNHDLFCLFGHNLKLCMYNSLAVLMQISIKKNEITLQECAVLLQFSSVT